MPMASTGTYLKVLESTKFKSKAVDLKLYEPEYMYRYGYMYICTGQV